MEHSQLIGYRPTLIKLKSWKEGRKEFLKKYGSYKKYIYSKDWVEKCKKFLEESEKECE